MTLKNTGPAAARITPVERAVVLGGFAVAALCTALAAPLDTGLEAVAGCWLAAAAWAFVSSLTLAIRRGLRNRDWSAFRRSELSDNTEVIDWSTRTGAYAWMRIAEENERLMRGD